MGWCDFCQTTHSSASCFHPGAAAYSTILAALTAAQAEIAEKDALLAKLGGIAYLAGELADVVAFNDDGDECDFDHHGSCQAHGCGDWGDRDVPHCPTSVQRDRVAALRAALTAAYKEGEKAHE